VEGRNGWGPSGGQAGRVVALYRTRAADLRSHADRVADALATDRSGAAAEGTLPSRDEIDAAAAAIVEATDPEWGGVRSRMKFPMVPVWDFALHRYRATGDLACAGAVRRTLDAMATGGIRDHVGGGFHRYSTDRAWLIPHFEKMLCDNALLARLYVEASVALREPAFAEVARDTLDFVLRDLAGPDGTLFAGIDADSPGPDGASREGACYLWRVGEVRDAVGRGEGDALEWLLGVTPDGNVDGASVLTRRTPPAEASARFGIPPDRAATLFVRHRAALAAARACRPAPATDRKQVTSWAGLAIAALAEAGLVLGASRYLDAASRAADRVWAANRFADSRLARVSYEGRPAAPGTLDDHAHLAYGLLWLHRATGDAVHLDRVFRLIEEVRARFAHRTAGFNSTADDAVAPFPRRAEPADNALPSGAAVFARVLSFAGVLAGRSDWVADARAALASCAASAVRQPFGMASWLDAAALPFRVAVIAGDDGLLAAAFRELDPPHATVVPAPAPASASGPDPATAASVPVAAGKTAIGGGRTAWVCDPSRCEPPARSAHDFRAALMRGWVVQNPEEAPPRALGPRR